MSIHELLYTDLGNSQSFERSSQGGWVKLVEYGEHSHPLGLQCLTRQSAQDMSRSFSSLLGRLKRKFGGIPIYIGHPDDPAFAGTPGHHDTRAYGWVRELEARPDGLWMSPKWGPVGQTILENAFYKFLSPRWALRPLGNGRYEPTELISIGLTNQPNIPGEAIANAQAPVATAVGTVANIKPLSLPTQSKTMQLKFANTGPRRNFRTEVEARMRLHGEDYATAWGQAKRAFPDAYAALES
ncbi:MAG: hypothetical protein B7X06_00050 [Verrucomicrobia bacterium 21-51-4]|nr:MAG: hypothetical protein B7X06_00050 [Verrucomicrobia bacterium 21-51-4]HQU08358.1 phage protease [Opitutales bacterium]